VSLHSKKRKAGRTRGVGFRGDPQREESATSDLKIKTFVGTSANAVHIQVWTALIAILLLKYLQFKSRMG
jgi:hypothetical protein